MPKYKDTLKRAKLWVDMGTEEGLKQDSANMETVESAQNFVEVLHENGLIPGRNYFYYEAQGGKHNHTDFGKRFDRILLYFHGR